MQGEVARKIPFCQNSPNKTEKIAKRAENRRAENHRYSTKLHRQRREKNAAHPHPPSPRPSQRRVCPFSAPKTPGWYRSFDVRDCRKQRTMRSTLAPPPLPPRIWLAGQHAVLTGRPEEKEPSHADSSLTTAVLRASDFFRPPFFSGPQRQLSASLLRHARAQDSA